ncbi:hypothetical protein G9U51_10870 [Calidifontibacter sp. DB0510]|uniref:Nbr1 FW domain-containing protein n=1 Tax=Metallococcus carri TaxID=1656884 RepID=A0A967B634_9MICO|nr:NBR1-Ig-like domain-containing protein [Metallococcus carri]NHN56277.1 hypothetical protein [Metallococcus carri]NOP38671.1 hypothetical protein [Calidifontibacter sp. DB2511S]
MSQGSKAARAAAIEGFAARLARVRAEAGNPPFREMAGRSGAISHTTLHDAVQGHRLPSWATTVEFLKACGADPGEHEAAWREADAVVSGAGPADGGLDDSAGGARERPVEGGSVQESAGPARRKRWPILVAIAVAVALAVGGLTAYLITREKAPSPAKPTYAAADCPVRLTNPPSAPPKREGDHARFVKDVTVPDCSHVQRGATFTKTWRLKNTGTLVWTGYTMRRLDVPQGARDCQTITDVPVPTAQPGQTVDVSVTVTAPNVATFCFVRFKLLEGGGQPAFPGGRPVNLQVIVD